MPTTINQIKSEVTELSNREFDKLFAWMLELSRRREYKKLTDDSKGIPGKDVLQKFKQDLPLSANGRVLLEEAGDGNMVMAEFYKEVRVKGCRFENDADMLLAEWGPESKHEFRLAYTRQVIPPRPDGEDQIWQLTLDMRFPMSGELKRVKEGNQWFRSLRQLYAFEKFAYYSQVGKILAETKPRRVSLSYGNVE